MGTDTTARKLKRGEMKCLTCTNKAQTRGVCWRCRAAARAGIETGKTTEVELIKAGLLLPSKGRGRAAESGMAKAIQSLPSRKARSR